MRILSLLLFQLCIYPIFSQTDSLCTVQIELDSSLIPRQLITTVTGTSPFTYEWSNTRQTEKINLNQSGSYEVTITDATGCTSMDEFDYFQCSVSIVEDTTESGILLKAEAIGTPPFQYFWSNSPITQDSIIPNGTGRYAVTISDATACNAAIEYDYIDRDSSNHLIEGRIRNRGNNRDIFFEGTVYLYQQLSDQNFELIDSVAFGTVADWSPFSFGEVAEGTYIFQVILDPDSDGYDEFLPTYYGPAIQWQNARYFTIPYSGTLSADMLLYSKRVVEGDGFISGILIEEGNLRGPSESRSQELSGYTIILKNESNRPIDYTFTNELGEFTFPNIEFGNYSVLVEKIGYVSAEVPIELTATYPTISTVQFLVDLINQLVYQEIETSTDTDALSSSPIQLFPNPAHSSFSIESFNEVVEVHIYDCLGRKRTVNRNNQVVDISQLDPGVYFVKIQTKRLQLFSEIIIKK